MKKFVKLRKIPSSDETVVLDTERGTFATQPGSSESIEGNYTIENGQELSVFAADHNLFFQWNNKRWNFKDLRAKLRYQHDLQRKITIFSIGDVTIQYPAWWVGDPTFQPFIPERDQDEDFFGYIASLARDDEWQRTLIETWDK